jgi:hypothetical protein
MKRILFVSLALVALFCACAEATMTYGVDYYLQRRSAIGSGTSGDPLRLFINEVETTLDGEAGIASLLLTPTATAPTATEGTLYYDSASDALLLRNASAWVTIDTAGGTSLDGSYNLGNTIDVDGSPVTLTTSDGDNNIVLQVTQNEISNNNIAMQITNTGTGDSLQFASSGTNDIDGTSSSWQASAAGTITAVGLVAGASDITLENGGIINNTTNNEIEFIENSEEFSFAFNGNTLTFATDTGITAVDWGALTTASGMTTITGDAADMTISITADAGGEDLLIQQAGAVDGSLDLRSAGTGTDAIKIYASAAGIDLDATNSTIVMTNTANGANDDFTIELAGAQDSSLILQSAGTGGDAVSLITSAATGDIKINSGDMIDIDAADDILIDLAGAAGEDILVTNTGGSITLTATEAVSDAIVLNASTALGGIDITSNEDIDITTTGAAGEDINITNTGGSIAITATENVDGAINIIVNGGITEEMNIRASQGTSDSAIDIDASAGGIDVDAVKSLTLSSSEGSADSVVITSTAGGIDILAATTDGAAEDIDITLTGATNSSIDISSAGTGADAVIVESTAGGIDVDSALDITVDLSGAGSNLDIDSAAGSVYIDGGEAAANAIVIDASNAAGGIDIDYGTGNMVITGTGASADFTLDADLISIDGTGTSNISFANGAGEDVTIATTGAADHSLILSAAGTAADAIQITTSGGGIDITCGTDGDTEDLDIALTGATNSSIDITSAGTGNDAVILEATAGGVDINAKEMLTLDVAAGTAATADIIITNTPGTDDAAIAIQAVAGGLDIDAAKSVTIASSEGSADSVVITSTGGGVDILAATTDAGNEDIDITLSGATDSSIILTSSGTGIDAIKLHSNGGTGSGIYLHSDTGNAAADGASSIQLTSDVGGIGLKATGETDADAITLNAAAGGIDIDAADDINILLTSTGANEDILIATTGAQDNHVTVTSTGTSADAIKLHSNGGTGSGIYVHSQTGTGAAAATESDAAIQLVGTVGGIGLLSALNGANAIRLEANGGGNETVILHSNQGTGASAAAESDASVQLLSDLGGIGLYASRQPGYYRRLHYASL